MIDLIVTYQWELFITMEIMSLVAILSFGVTRYFFDKRSLSLLFLFLFIALTALEAGLAWIIYQETGEISSFQVIVTIFVLYAVTFGISDFKKLDRWMRQKIGGWRGINLLTERDEEMMRRQKDPAHIARKYRYTSTAHLVIFLLVQAVFWMIGTGSLTEAVGYLQDFSWLDSENITQTPYPNEMLFSISSVWTIVLIVDLIWSWSYTFAPPKQKT